LFLFAVLHHFCQYFDLFEIKIGAADISALSNNTKAPKKVAKRCNKGRNEAIVWHWAKFSAVLHLGFG